MAEVSYGRTVSGQQVLVLKEGTSQSRGRQAQSNNIVAAKLIAKALKTSPGPRGINKMLVDNMGDITITRSECNTEGYGVKR